MDILNDENEKICNIFLPNVHRNSSLPIKIELISLQFFNNFLLVFYTFILHLFEHLRFATLGNRMMYS